jgi:hypothetical protein
MEYWGDVMSLWAGNPAEPRFIEAWSAEGGLKNAVMQNLDRVLPGETGGRLMAWQLAGLQNLRIWQCWRSEPVRRPNPRLCRCPRV